MGKVFYTEWDVEEMHRRGVVSIDVHDDVVLTDLARDRAFKLGIKLNPAKAGASAGQPPRAPAIGTPSARTAGDDALVQQVTAGVLARLGDRRVDPALLDAVIRRVLAALPPA